MAIDYRGPAVPGGEVSPGSGSTGFAPGAIPFANASGQLASDTAGPRWDSTLNHFSFTSAAPNTQVQMDANSSNLGQMALTLHSSQAVPVFQIYSSVGPTPLMGFSSLGILQWGFGTNFETTVAPSSVGGGAALPATPARYLKVQLSSGGGGWVPVYSTNAGAP